MKSLLGKLFSLRKYFCLYLFCSLYPGLVAAERGGFLYLKFFCYQNPENKLLTGIICDRSYSKICDPLFTICITNHFLNDPIMPEKCSVYYQQTNYYSNMEAVCNQPYDNRKGLAMDIVKELSFPLHKSYFIKIEVTDHSSNGYSMIGAFGAELNQIPSPNMSKVVYKNFKMYRTDFRYANPRASLNISVGLQCDYDRYGEYCLNFCKPHSQNTVSCTENGKRVCEKGWKGEKCATKDLCAFVSCIDGAHCLEIKGKAECLCNKQIGPHCFSNYNPCSNKPCENEGICSSRKPGEPGYDCQCKFPFSGPQCAIKVDICESKPCRNNASCHHLVPNVFHCKCLQGFKGRLCELNNSSSFNSIRNSTEMFPTPAFHNSLKISRVQPVIICSIFFGILFVILVIVFTTCFIKKRNAKIDKKNQRIDEKPMSKKYLEGKNSSLRVISNQYLDAPRTETVYEEINERDIYESLVDKNDEYLIPSNVNTLSASQLQIYNSDYLDMSEKYETYKSQPREVPVQNDSFYLPPLPTRETKSKFGLIKILFP